MRGPPVVLTNTLGRPVTNIISERGAVPMTVVNTLGEPVTLVAQGGEPVTLFNENGTLWDYPFSLFANNEQGAWYDPSDYSTLYQTSTGTTPVTAVEQPVGLMLDRSRGLVLGSELKGNFGIDITGVATPATYDTSTGVGSVTRVDLVNQSYVTLGSLNAGTYKVTITCNTGTILVRQGTFSGTSILTVTAGQSADGYVDTVNRISITHATSAGSATFTLTSVKALPGNHATQSSSASRPILRARYNLLTYSEQFDDAAWQKAFQNLATAPTVTANAGASPLGDMTAERVQFSRTGTSTVDRSRLDQPNIPIATNTDYVFSVWLKSFSGTDQRLTIYQNIGAATPQEITITSEWQRFSYVANSGASTINQVILALGYLAGSPTSADVLVWGASLLTAADQTATGGAYQRVGAATDYDTSNPVWRPYLAFDGSDDSMSTASVDFSGTDEMTVFAGVTKLSDAAQGLFCELTATSASNNGAFTLLVPDTPNDYAWASRGTARAFPVVNGFDAPITNVLTGIGDISDDVATLRVNGAQAATSSTDQGTGNYANAALFIGSRGGSSLRFNGRLYALTVLGRTATAAELGAMEAWVAGKTGVTL